MGILVQCTIFKSVIKWEKIQPLSALSTAQRLFFFGGGGGGGEIANKATDFHKTFDIIEILDLKVIKSNDNINIFQLCYRVYRLGSRGRNYLDNNILN